jgi:hypothetical protein
MVAIRSDARLEPAGGYAHAMPISDVASPGIFARESVTRMAPPTEKRPQASKSAGDQQLS